MVVRKPYGKIPHSDTLNNTLSTAMLPPLHCLLLSKHWMKENSSEAITPKESIANHLSVLH